MFLVAPPGEDSTNRSSRRILERFQERLAQQFSISLNTLKDKIQDISGNCTAKLTERMDEYKLKQENISQKRKDILDTLTTSNESFKTLKEKILALGTELIDESKSLHKDSMVIYQYYFDQIAPLLEKVCEENVDIIPQIPEIYASQFETTISNINMNYLTQKKELIKTYYMIELDAMKSNTKMMEFFDQGIVEWRINRFESSIKQAKEKLSPAKPLDLTDLYQEFHTTHEKFIAQGKKVINSFNTVSPPKSISKDAFEKWWISVEEHVQTEENFIERFLAKVEDRINERNTENANYATELEMHLAEFKGSAEATKAMVDINPLVQIATEYNATMLEKITNYFNNRREVLNNAFKALKNVIEPLVDNYNEFESRVNKIDADFNENMKNITETSKRDLEDYEQELENKITEINMVANEEKIDQCVKECQEILEKIDVEYRKVYQNCIEILDKRPENIKEAHTEAEKKLLDLLHLIKTEESARCEFNIPQGKGSNAKAQKAKPKPKPKPKPKGKGKEKTSRKLFSFKLPDGSAYEENSEFIILPDVEEYSEFPTKGGKGKAKPKPKPKAKPKPKKGQKGQVDDYVEPAEFILDETIPKVDGKLLIDVFIPQTEDIDETFKTYEVAIITEFQNIFVREMENALDTQIKQELANQLNERLRMNAPRAKAIEINIANTRTLQIQGRKAQIENRIVQSVQQFNKSAESLNKTIVRRKEEILEECEMITSFRAALDQQKSTLGLMTYSQTFNKKDREFSDKLEDVKTKLMTQVENFEKTTNGVNERFLKTIDNDESIPEEEKNMTHEYYQRFQEQVDPVFESMRQKINEEIGEVETRHNTILEEFDELFEAHRQDIAFIEKIRSKISETKLKFQALVSRNKTREQEVNFTLDEISQTLNETQIDQPTQIQREFEKLDSLRVLIINRGVYLSQLVKPFDNNPLAFSVDFNGGLEPNLDGNNENTSSSQADRKSRSMKDRSKEKTIVLEAPPQPTNDPVAEQQFSFKSQVSSIYNKFSEDTVEIAKNYYQVFEKKRKTAITRPELIPQTEQELIEIMNNKWNEIVKDSDEIINTSITRFKSHIVAATNVSKEVIKDIYDRMQTYYNNIVIRMKKEVVEKFNQQNEEFEKEKLLNKKKLNPVIADPNNEELFNKLLQNEEERYQNQSKCVADYQSQVMELEKKVSKVFVSRLSFVASFLLQLFDRFVTTDDITKDSVGHSQIRRKTMKQMLIGQHKQTGERQTEIRTWPPLNNYTFQQSFFLTATEPTTNSRNSSRKKKTLRKSSERLISPVEKDLTITLQSMDAQLQRVTIIERNSSYDEYESAMRGRLDTLKEFTSKITVDLMGYQDHWKLCVAQLKKLEDQNFDEDFQ